MTKYEQHATTPVSEVPRSDMEIIITVFVKEAEIDMGAAFDEMAYPRLYDIICKDYSYLPVYSVAGAFRKGSTGQFGPGRLTPRTIYGWMNEMAQIFNQTSKGKADQIDTSKKWDGLHKYPVGKAINTKIDWLVSGRITESDYDKIPLQAMYERMSQGLDVVPELWGVTSKKKKDVW